MRPPNRRKVLEASAAASALIALGSTRTAAADPPDLTWTRSICRCCEKACGVHLGTSAGKVVAVKGDAESHTAGFLCLEGALLARLAAEPAGLAPRAAPGAAGFHVAGVLIVTAPGAEPRVAARLLGEEGLTLAGGDGSSRIAAVWTAADGATLQAAAGRLLAEDREIVGVLPTYVAEAAEP